MIRAAFILIQIFDLISTSAILEMGGREYNKLLINVVGSPGTFLALKILMVLEVFALAWLARYVSTGTKIKGDRWVIGGATAACVVPSLSNFLWLVGVGGL